VVGKDHFIREPRLGAALILADTFDIRLGSV